MKNVTKIGNKWERWRVLTKHEQMSEPSGNNHDPPEAELSARQKQHSENSNVTPTQEFYRSKPWKRSGAKRSFHGAAGRQGLPVRENFNQEVG